MFQTSNELILVYFAGTLFVFLLVAFLLLYVYLHQQKVNRYTLRLREQEIKKQQELFIALHEGEEKERKRLAEELHDGIGAKLSGLKMSLEYLANQKQLDAADKELLHRISLGMNESIEELREISQNLKPSILSNKGLPLALNEYIFHLKNKSDCYFQLFVDDFEEEIPFEFQITIYRIGSELLNNIHKHAKATHATLQILVSENMLQIIAEDNGKGFDEHNIVTGIGLANIKGRVAIYKGTINIDSSVSGTTIIIELPIQENK